jgi:hypothetical protein
MGSLEWAYILTDGINLLIKSTSLEESKELEVCDDYFIISLIAELFNYI